MRKDSRKQLYELAAIFSNVCAGKAGLACKTELRKIFISKFMDPQGLSNFHGGRAGLGLKTELGKIRISKLMN